MDEFDRLVDEVEKFYREYFNLSEDEEAFLFLYMGLKRRRGILGTREHRKEVLRVPSNLEKLKSLHWLIDKKLKKEVLK